MSAAVMSSVVRASRRSLGETYRIARFILLHPANHGRRPAALARAARFQLLARVTHRPSIARLGDRSRIWVHLHSTGATKALYANPPDWPEMLVWQRYLKPGDLFIDIGANIGTYAIIALERGAEVVAVEPDPIAATRLRENIRLNSYSAEVVEKVVLDQSGMAAITTEFDCTNRVVEPETASSRLVPAITLDELLGDRIAAGVKIDIEGAERLVINGARKALSEGRVGLLQLEWNHAAVENFGEPRERCGVLLENLGYELFRPAADGTLQVCRNPAPGVDIFARKPLG